MDGLSNWRTTLGKVVYLEENGLLLYDNINTSLCCQFILISKNKKKAFNIENVGFSRLQIEYRDNTIYIPLNDNSFLYLNIEGEILGKETIIGDMVIFANGKQVLSYNFE